MAAVEPTENGQIDSQAILRKIGQLESLIDSKVGQDDLKELQESV